MRWLTHSRWSDEVDPLDAGVSWYELCLSYMYATRRGVVINTGGTGPMFRPLQLELNNPDVDFGRQVFAFERAMATLQTLLGRTIFFGDRTMVRSLRIMGGTKLKTGLSPRPSFPYQQEIVTNLVAYFASNTEDAGAPTVPAIPPIVLCTEDSRDERDQQLGWQIRASRYKTCRRKSRRS